MEELKEDYMDTMLISKSFSETLEPERREGPIKRRKNTDYIEPRSSNLLNTLTFRRNVAKTPGK